MNTGTFEPPSRSPHSRKGWQPCHSPPNRVGRRERNKQDKLDRITAAARELFAEHGVDEVTTQQIADKADIGAGTLFLYAKTKGELLLLVQNSTLRRRARRRYGRRPRASPTYSTR